MRSFQPFIILPEILLDYYRLESVIRIVIIASKYFCLSWLDPSPLASLRFSRFSPQVSGSPWSSELDVAHVAKVRWNSWADTSLEYARSSRLSFLKERTSPPNMRPRSYRLFSVLNCSLDHPGIDDYMCDAKKIAREQSKRLLKTHFWNYIVQKCINIFQYIPNTRVKICPWN